MIGNFQIRLLNFRQPTGILFTRSFSHNCTKECSESEKEKLSGQGVVSFSIKCYLMASYSNGVEVARGLERSFTLVSPFDQALNDFNCTGINHY